jgi:CRP-like cAMP-binding protein
VSIRTKGIQETLRETEVFRGLTNDELDLVADLCSPEFHPAGLTLSQQGDDIDKLYVVQEGLVQFRFQIGATRYWSVDSSSEGECFGWAALLGPPYTWASEARCAEHTTLLTVDAARLRALCQSYPRIGFVVMSGIGRVVTQRLEKSRQQVAMLADKHA